MATALKRARAWTRRGLAMATKVAGDKEGNDKSGKSDGDGDKKGKVKGDKINAYQDEEGYGNGGKRG